MLADGKALTHSPSILPATTVHSPLSPDLDAVRPELEARRTEFERDLFARASSLSF